MAVQPIPDDYHSVTPNLIVDGAAECIEFMSKAFGAKERMRFPGPDGRVAHAEITIGDSPIMVTDGSPDFPPMPSLLHLYVENVDDVFNRAIEAGATSERPVENQFYGDRSGIVRDKWGNQWSIATHVEDVSDEETVKRMQEMSSA